MTSVRSGRIEAVIGRTDLFRQTGYRLLWSTDLLGNIAINAIVYTLFIVIVDETTAFLGNLFAATYILPAALLTPITASVVDRLPKGQIIIFANVLRALLALALAAWIEFLPALYLIAIALSIVSQFEGPAKSTSVHIIVKEHELDRANALKRVGSMLSQLLGVAVLPFIFLTVDASAVLVFICALLFMAAAVLALQIDEISGRLVNLTHAAEGSMDRIKRAWDQLRGERDVYVGLYFYTLAGVLSLTLVPLIPEYTNNVLGLSHELGVFVVAPAVIGVWAALRFDRPILALGSVGWLMAGAFAILVAGVLVIAFVEPLSMLMPSIGEKASMILVTGLVAIAFGFGYTFVNIVQNFLVNERIRGRFQGSVFTLQTVLSALASIPPLLAAGALADSIGTTSVFLIAGAIGGGVGIFAVRVSGLRRERRPEV